MNPLIQGYSGTAPETCPNALSTRHGTNEDEYQSDPHPEAGIFRNQMTQYSGPAYGKYMVTGVEKESLGPRYGDRSSQRSHSLLPQYTFRKARKNHSTSQPQFRNENTPATTEADQIFVGPSAVGKQFCKFPKEVLTDFPNCQSRSRPRCPRLTGNLKSSISLKIFCKGASKSIIT